VAKEYPRTRRIAEQLKRELAELLRSEADDPRLALVSITSVVVSRDLAHAKVYVTLLGYEDQRAQVVDALNGLAPELRRLLGRMLRLRVIPRLVFSYDEVIERGAALSALIDQAVAADRQRESSDNDSGSV
jgi:ribosome-binding factor A